MTRLLGAALLAAGSAALGFGAVARLEGRVRDLRGMLAGLEVMRRSLESCLAPLDRMLAAAAEATEGRPGGVFRACMQGMAGGERQSFGVLWTAALDELPLRLEETDLEALRPLGGVLGRFDADSQSAALEQTMARLEVQLREAAERRRRLGRVYGTVGVTVGLFLVILLL